VLLALALAAGLLLKPFVRRRPFTVTIIAALSCFYIAGEEMTWGQHFFHWNTPEYWAAVNRQEETNLHNTYAIFDKWPRAILELGVLIGGILIPVAATFDPRVRANRLSLFLPAAAQIPPPATSASNGTVGINKRNESAAPATLGVTAMTRRSASTAATTRPSSASPQPERRALLERVLPQVELRVRIALGGAERQARGIAGNRRGLDLHEASARGDRRTGGAELSHPQSMTRGPPTRALPSESSA